MPLRAWVLLATCSALWGLPYLLIKVAVEDGASPAVMTLGRTAIGAAVLVPIALWRGSLRGLARRWRAIAVLAALDFTVPFLLLGAAERDVDSSLAGILIATVPLMIAVLAIRLDHSERVTGGRLAGLVAGFGGVCLLLGVEVAGSPEEAVAALLILLASLVYAAATLWFKREFSRDDPIGVVAATLVAAAILATPAAALDPSTGTSDAVTAIAALGVLCSAAAYVVFYALIQLVGASRASVNTYISPPIAVALGVLFLDEPLGAAALAGMAIILCGSWLATRGAEIQPAG